LQSGFAELELKPLRIRHIADPEPDYPGNRMNDAKVDPFGRIWAGTMDADMKKETGALYRLDTDLTISRQDRGYMVTNGPAFGAQGECLYHTDSPRRTVYRFDLSPDGAISAKRIFIEFPRGWGVPDGMTVDVDGGLWIAHWGGGRISRFTPNGELDRSIALPASQITSCAFAGEALDRLFVTSAALDRDDEEMAGMLFEVDPGVRGIAPNRFAG
jgi:sugar lactone lactonase YvrE